MLEQIKGISEAKAGKLLNEGEQLHQFAGTAYA